MSDDGSIRITKKSTGNYVISIPDVFDVVDLMFLERAIRNECDKRFRQSSSDDRIVQPVRLS